jgi:CheY-like chemotaxis protein
MEKGLQIFIVEDDPHDAELIDLELGKLGVKGVLNRVETEKEFLKAIQEFSPDIILYDYKMPAFDGMIELKQKIEFLETQDK